MGDRPDLDAVRLAYRRGLMDDYILDARVTKYPVRGAMVIVDFLDIANSLLGSESAGMAASCQSMGRAD